MSRKNETILVPVNVQYGKLPFGEEPDTLLLMSIDQDGDKRWKSIGTAFPMLHGKVLAIITAAHALKDLDGFPLMALNPKNRKAISLKDSQILYSEDIDVAVIQCSSNDLSELFETCTCIEANYDCVSSQDSGADSLYQVYGYPRSKNKFSRSTPFNTYGFRVSLGTRKTLPERSKLSDIGMPTLCFDLDIRNLMNDERKKTLQIGKFDGMSGGPIIRHATSTGALPGTLVGMFVEWHAVERTAVAVPISTIAAWIETWCS
jgi:hypothetical protein